MKSVLIIEDSLAMLRGLEDNFQLKGYQVRTAIDGEQGLNVALSENPDLIILDIMLPKINGYEICSQIRKNNLDMPIIILTAKGEESDIVLGLNLGADDYVTKPFSIKELLARAQALLRRKQTQEPLMYKFGNCQFNIAEQTLERDGKDVKLSPGEFKLLRLFLKKAGYALTCEEILQTVWGYSHFMTLRDVDRTIVALRNKVECDPNKPTFIRTIEGIGYKFELGELNGNNPDN